MRSPSQLPVPPALMRQFLDEQGLEKSPFADADYELLDEDRAQMIVGLLHTLRLWGSEERGLLKELMSKMEAVLDRVGRMAKEVQGLKEGRSGSKIIPVEVLSDALGLRRPIFAVVEHGEGVVTATYYECEIFGEGETEFEALDDLRQSLAEYFLSLRESPETLGPLLAKHLHTLSELVYER